MTFKVVHADQRNAEGIGQGFPEAHTHEEGPGEAGPPRDCNGMEVGPGDPGLPHRLSDHDLDRFHVAASSQLWNDATESSMDVVLGIHHARGDLVGTTPDSGGGFIAGRL